MTENINFDCTFVEIQTKLQLKIYTKTGDKGDTHLFGGRRISKSNLIIEALGSVDELNSIIGVVRSFSKNSLVDTQLLKIQNDLFVLGSEVATPSDKSKLKNLISEEDTKALESWIDGFEENLPPLRYFILPSGNQEVSFLHFARAVCRRSERVFAELKKTENIRRELLMYINRLSDYLFVLARYILKESGGNDVHWNSKE